MSLSAGSRVGPYEIAGSLGAGRPQVLFEVAMLVPTGSNRPYDLAPDGRFIVIRPAEEETLSSTAPSLILVQNWQEELKRLVPVN